MEVFKSTDGFGLHGERARETLLQVSDDILFGEALRKVAQFMLRNPEKYVGGLIGLADGETADGYIPLDHTRQKGLTLRSNNGLTVEEQDVLKHIPVRAVRRLFCENTLLPWQGINGREPISGRSFDFLVSDLRKIESKNPAFLQTTKTMSALEKQGAIVTACFGGAVWCLNGYLTMQGHLAAIEKSGMTLDELQDFTSRYGRPPVTPPEFQNQGIQTISIFQSKEKISPFLFYKTHGSKLFCDTKDIYIDEAKILPLEQGQNISSDAFWGRVNLRLGASKSTFDTFGVAKNGHATLEVIAKAYKSGFWSLVRQLEQKNKGPWSPEEIVALAKTIANECIAAGAATIQISSLLGPEYCLQIGRRKFYIAPDEKLQTTLVMTGRLRNTRLGQEHPGVKTKSWAEIPRALPILQSSCEIGDR